MSSDVDIGTLPISDDVFQSDIFLSEIGITDVDVGCRISPTLRSMSMPTYARNIQKVKRIVQTPINS